MTEKTIKILPPSFARGWTVVEREDGTLFTWFDYEEAITRHDFAALEQVVAEKKDD
jgi:hypothetical protein